MDLDRLWKNTQEELKVILAPAVYQTFVSRSQLISLLDQTATLSCPNSYLVDLIKKRYLDLFKAALDHQSKLDLNLKFIVQEPVENTPPSADPVSAPLLSYNSPQNSTAPSLHPKYTFANLIVGNSNNFAFAAAQGIVKNPGLSYNPFFIWGGVGVGKTHLMQAIGHELYKNNPSLKIKYFPAETFGNELISALKSKDMNRFKDKYRKADVILVDDVQFIAGKEYIQEEFFHTFNALHMAGKQVVLTSDRKPSDIDRLEDRLVSRFMGGLTVDIQLPDYEMRVAIINQKAHEKGIDLDPSVTTFLAENIVSNIRDIEGRLQEMIVQALAQNVSHIDVDFITQLFNPSSSPFYPSNQKDITPRHLISVCAKFFNIKTGDLTGKSRQKELVTARHFTAYLLLTELSLPLEQVGRLLGGRDHTSIMHARDKIHTDLSTNPQTKSLIHQIKALL